MASSSQAALAPAKVDKRQRRLSGGFDRPVRVALWQGALRSGCSWAAELRAQAKAARAEGAELLLTPELCLPGFHFFGKEGFEPSPAVVEDEVSAIARDEGIALCVGYAERVDGSAHSFWNTAILVDYTGDLKLRYRKHHLWGNESGLGIRASDEDVSVVELSLPGPPSPCVVRTSMVICYDVEYPEMVRILACAPHNVELLLVPTALPYTEPNAALKIVPARAMENRIFIAYCNYPCVPRVDGEYFCGHTCFAGPDGEIWAGPCDWAEEKLLVCDLGWSDHLRWLAQETPYLRDRRPDFYRSQGHCQVGRDPVAGELRSL